MDIVFLAAGMGTRLSKAKLKHKCLLKVYKKSLIMNLVENAVKSNIKNINIVTGHNGEYIEKHFKNLKHLEIKFIKNNYYKTSNISYSIYLALLNTSKHNDLLISYSDIYYKKSLLKLINKKKGDKILLPVLLKWKVVWNYRKENILEDAENLETKRNYVTEIGGKISNISDVKYQYMGLIFIPKNLKKKIIKFIKIKKLNKLDGTKLINKLINNKFDVKILKYNGPWYEFDKGKDKKNFTRYIKNYSL